VALPKGVHRVIARAREYFYFQANRGTPLAGPRIALPHDPHSPEFWIALRNAQGIEQTAHSVVTMGMVCDLYEAWPLFAKLASGTQQQYRYSLKIVRAAWGDLPAAGLRPVHVQALMDELADKPGKANNVLGLLWALSKWGVKRDYFPHSITEGITPYRSDGGHKPWTAAQLAAAEANLTGMLRRAYFLARYTGQRGSDVVKLGETFIDEGGFRILQQKNGRKIGDIWCPIEDQLAAEMATWEREPGPYLRQAHGKRYSKDLLHKHFLEAREKIPELAGVTFHGLRATRVVELRQRGATTLQIQDQVGMSPKMIERYCRFADRKANGKAAVFALAERRKNSGL
jgi:integrase